MELYLLLQLLSKQQQPSATVQLTSTNSFTNSTNNATKAGSNEQSVLIGIIVGIIAFAVTILLWRVFWWHKYRMLQRRQRDDAALLLAARRAAAQRAAAEQSAAAEARADAALEMFDAASVATDSLCAVCLDRLDVAAGDVLAAPCMHVLHAACWRGWLAKDASRACPICRASVLVDDEGEEQEEQEDVHVHVDMNDDEEEDNIENQRNNINNEQVTIQLPSQTNNITVSGLTRTIRTRTTGENEEPMSEEEECSQQSVNATAATTNTIGTADIVTMTGSPSQQQQSQSSTASSTGASTVAGRRNSNFQPSRGEDQVLGETPDDLDLVMLNDDVGGEGEQGSQSVGHHTNNINRGRRGRRGRKNINNRNNNVMVSVPVHARHLSLLSHLEQSDADHDNNSDLMLAYTIDGSGRRRQLSLVPVTSGPTSNSRRDVAIRRRLLAASAAINRLDEGNANGNENANGSGVNDEMASETRNQSENDVNNSNRHDRRTWSWLGGSRQNKLF